MKHHRYKYAPITEAIIDFRVELAPDYPVERLKKVNEGLESNYPNVNDLYENVGQMQFGPHPSVEARSKHSGFLFANSENTLLYQSRINGFTTSHLAPYENWNSFQTVARSLWELYRSQTKPSKITRLAVRYINRIDIPLPLRNFEDYLRTFLTLSPELPQEINRFFINLLLPLDEINGYVQINETIMEPSNPNVVSIVLDIDVFRTNDVPTDENSIWNLFEVLHHAKNDVFEACITDNARELFVICDT